MKQQIIVMVKGGNRWAFVAHGAVYSAEEASSIKAAREARGDRVKLLPVKA